MIGESLALEDLLNIGGLPVNLESMEILARLEARRMIRLEFSVLRATRTFKAVVGEIGSSARSANDASISSVILNC